MTKIFSATKLQDIVAPYDLIDVLESLMSNGLVDTWDWDYLRDEITISIPVGVEVKEVMAGFQEIVDTGRKRTEH